MPSRPPLPVQPLQSISQAQLCVFNPLRSEGRLPGVQFCALTDDTPLDTQAHAQGFRQRSGLNGGRGGGLQVTVCAHPKWNTAKLAPKGFFAPGIDLESRKAYVCWLVCSVVGWLVPSITVLSVGSGLSSQPQEPLLPVQCGAGHGVGRLWRVLG